MPLKISNQLLIQEAKKRGWKTEAINEDRSSYIVIYPEGYEPIVLRSTVSELSTAVGNVAANNKQETYDLCQKFGVAMPESMIYEEENPALDFLKRHNKVVVKPTDQNHGDGVTVGVTTPEDLRRAIEHAKGFSEMVLLQQHCEGKDHRLLVLQDKVIAAAYRVPPSVEGDGVKTIRQLIHDKNADQRRNEGHQSPLTLIDAAMVARFIGEDQLAKVLAPGENVVLLGTANLSKGGEAIDITDKVHPDIQAMAVKAAKILQLGFCGIDIITTDISQSPQIIPAYLIEANVSPGLRMHHFPSSGQARNVAKELLDAIIAHRKV